MHLFFRTGKERSGCMNNKKQQSQYMLQFIFRRAINFSVSIFATLSKKVSIVSRNAEDICNICFSMWWKTAVQGLEKHYCKVDLYILLYLWSSYILVNCEVGYKKNFQSRIKIQILKWLGIVTAQVIVNCWERLGTLLPENCLMWLRFVMCSPNTTSILRWEVLKNAIATYNEIPLEEK